MAFLPPNKRIVHLFACLYKFLLLLVLLPFRFLYIKNLIPLLCVCVCVCVHVFVCLWSNKIQIQLYTRTLCVPTISQGASGWISYNYNISVPRARFNIMYADLGIPEQMTATIYQIVQMKASTAFSFSSAVQKSWKPRGGWAKNKAGKRNITFLFIQFMSCRYKLFIYVTRYDAPIIMTDWLTHQSPKLTVVRDEIMVLYEQSEQR